MIYSDTSLPPAPFHSGKRYYLFLRQHGGPFIVAGAALLEEKLGGSWLGRGTAPRGFASLEEALKALHTITGDRKEEVQ